MAKMKRNKSAGPDEIVIDVLTALEGFGIEKVTKVINKVSNTGEIPEDLSKSIFIALPKRAAANELPDLFNLYNEMILRVLEDLPRLVIGGHNINNIRNAHDPVLIADHHHQ